MRTPPRLQPVPRAHWTEDQLRALGAIADRPQADNVLTTLVRHPDLFRRYRVFGSHVLSKSELSPSLRELAILRIGFRRRCAYEFAQHYRLALQVGLSPAQASATEIGPQAPVLTRTQRDVLRAVDELVDGGRITGPTWDDLIETLGERALLDLIFAAGAYNLICWFLESVGVELDDHLDLPSWAATAGDTVDLDDGAAR